MENSIIWENKLSLIRADDKGEEGEICLEESDAQLVRLVLEGSEAAFEVIFEKYKRIVAIVAARYFREPEQIEEIIQISFAKAYFELKQFRGKNEFSLASWLSKITANTCLDLLKKKKRKPEDLLFNLSNRETENLLGIQTSGENIENDLVGRDLAEKLLSNLSESDRALLQMIFAEEMSIAEIAEITGKSKTNIKVRAYRARLALRRILKKFL